MTWKDVPDDMERYSNLSGTGVPLIKDTATSLLIRYKRQCRSVR